jgi:murein DD-endopeptidase MepM/ murein hydrolase activator NlpD
MLPVRTAVTGLLLVVVAAGCADDRDDRADPSPAAPSSSARSTHSAGSTPSSPTATPPTRAPRPVHREHRPDPRWQFFTDDRGWYRSPWYAGAHRVMIGFGCNTAPWYSHDARCPGDQGFHHGVDVAMSCGTPLFAGVAGKVLPLDAPGSPGSAYGVSPVRLRVDGPGGAVDVLLGHTRKVFVHAGERVRAGQRLALASDSAAPDGCHLHFEVRPAGGDVATAVDPASWMELERG